MSEVNKHLNDIRVLLGNESNWCKGGYFRNAEGALVDRHHAKSFCLVGAIITVCSNRPEPFYETYNALEDALQENCTLVTFNDALETTHKDILALVDKAIANVGA